MPVLRNLAANMIKVETPVLLAAIGLIGAAIGAAIQIVVARFNRKSERLLSFESKLSEIRLNTYLELVRYIMRREYEAGRDIGLFDKAEVRSSPYLSNEDGAPPAAGNVDDDFAARLTALSSSALRLTLLAWRLSYVRNQSSKVLKDCYEAAQGVPEMADIFSAEDKDNIERLIEITERHTKAFANDINEQVVRELEGAHPWHRPRGRIRGYRRRRRAQRARWAEGELVEELREKMGEVMSVFLERHKELEEAAARRASQRESRRRQSWLSGLGVTTRRAQAIDRERSV